MWDGECSVWASPIAWTGRAVCWEPLGQHLQVFPWLCPPRPLGGVPILLTEHGSTWQCPGSQEERACENLLPFSFSKHRTLSSSVPFQPYWVLLSQRYLLLWKISKIYKSQEDSATINPHAPITPVHQWLLCGYFPFTCIRHSLPQVIIKQRLNISVLCFPETKHPEFCQWGEGFRALTSFRAAFPCCLSFRIYTPALGVHGPTSPRPGKDSVV